MPTVVSRLVIGHCSHTKRVLERDETTCVLQVSAPVSQRADGTNPNPILPYLKTGWAPMT